MLAGGTKTSFGATTPTGSSSVTLGDRYVPSRSVSALSARTILALFLACAFVWVWSSTAEGVWPSRLTSLAGRGTALCSSWETRCDSLKEVAAGAGSDEPLDSPGNLRARRSGVMSRLGRFRKRERLLSGVGVTRRGDCFRRCSRSKSEESAGSLPTVGRRCDVVGLSVSGSDSDEESSFIWRDGEYRRR